MKCKNCNKDGDTCNAEVIRYKRRLFHIADEGDSYEKGKITFEMGSECPYCGCEKAKL